MRLGWRSAKDWARGGDERQAATICNPNLMVYRLGKQASGNNVEQKGVRRYPELFHLDAARIRTD